MRIAATIAALALLSATTPLAGTGKDVVHMTGTDVAAAFAKGAVLLEQENYKIHASRREAPGKGEVHVNDTDIIHVLDGTATFVTGGRLVDPEETAPGEIRGRSVRGGQERRIGKGDVVVVPAGVPHWFEEVEAPFTYFVVKVSAP